MKKLLFPCILFVLITNILFSQPIINQDDMPNIGDTLRVNIPLFMNGNDYSSTGSNFLWDFSNLIPNSQRVDTFKSVQSTSILYYIYFMGATISGTRPNISTIPTISIADVYNFYKETATSYSQLGFGAKFNDVPLPVKYDNPDVTMHFPVTYGEKDSCDFSYHVTIPSMGYFGESKHRVNYVDGWGNVITPTDTFPVIRVLSKITSHDTVHLDSAHGNFGFAVDFKETEYKWYADNMGIPVMKITVRTGTGAATSIEYSNNPIIHSGLNDVETSLIFVSLYPNPVNEHTNLYFSLSKSDKIEINIFDVLGRNIKNVANKEFAAGFNSIPVDIFGLEKGIYFVNIKSGNNSKTLKLQVI